MTPEERARQLIDFGTFSVKERAAREGRNPRTGEVVKICSKFNVFGELSIAS